MYDVNRSRPLRIKTKSNINPKPEALTYRDGTGKVRKYLTLLNFFSLTEILDNHKSNKGEIALPNYRKETLPLDIIRSQEKFLPQTSE